MSVSGLESIDHAFVGDSLLSTTEIVAIAFQVLSTKIDAGETEVVRQGVSANSRALRSLPSKAT